MSAHKTETGVRALDSVKGSDPISDPFGRRDFLRGAVATAGLTFGAPLTALAQDIRGRALTRDVATTAGRIRGVVYDGDIQAFYGVPYGASTAGANRFMPPVPPAAWSGVRETIQVTERSPQPEAGPIPEIHALHRANQMGEDCLHVNVFTPALDNRRRAVMVWLHGGGFWSGSGDWLLYDGTQLARSEDVVVVSVTHRLNAFGFLYLPEIGGAKYADARNVGVRDIVLALDWVQNNIENFGGDPDRVTIFGQSGGGSKVSVLTAMPAAQGLYHRGIVMSGSLLEATDESTASEATERFIAESSARNIDELARMPWRQLRDEAERLQFRMGPTVDGATLPSHPYSPTAPALSSSVPLLIGTTEYEANFFPFTPLDPIDDAELLQRVSDEVGASHEEAARLIEVYRAGRPGIDNVGLYQIVASDAGFNARAHAQAERKVAQGTAPVYRYYFTWKSPVREGKLKSYHCIDIPFAFNNVDFSTAMTGAGNDRYALADRVSGAFASFAKSGNPNHDDVPHWPEFDTATRSTMIFDIDTRVVDDPYGAERVALARVIASS